MMKKKANKDPLSTQAGSVAASLALEEVLDVGARHANTGIEMVAFWKGARVALAYMLGVADDRDHDLAQMLKTVLRNVPGGDNPGHGDAYE